MIVTVTPNPAIDITMAVPQIEFDEVLRTTAVRRVWAGKALNAARTLKRMGTESVVIAFAGGYTGRAMADGLAEEGISSDFAWVAGETRIVVAIMDEGTGHFVKANPPGAAVTPAEHDAFLAKVRGRVQPGDLWVLTGSLPPGLAADFYAELIDIVQDAGAAAWLDTSGPRCVSAARQRPFLVKPNAEEAQEMTGQPVDTGVGGVAAVMSFLAAGARRVAFCWDRTACSWVMNSRLSTPVPRTCPSRRRSAPGMRWWLASPGRRPRAWTWPNLPAGA